MPKSVVSSQNRMNAGAEYVLYRVWATLQDREGVHAESLLACLGALAGYACQAYARRAGVRPELPLTESPLSLWALVRRSLQKMGNPVPDIENICAYVVRTIGTSEFGVPRVADNQRGPRRLPVFYLTQLWPQVLPIAQRFCRRPAQLPVLFGIALQRAIEHTTQRLNPTLGASIAMECAVAMSKASLPAALSELFQPPRAAGATAGAASAAAPGITLIPKRGVLPSSTASPSSQGNRSTTRKRGAPASTIGGIDPKTLEAGFFSARMRSAKVVATVLSLTIVAVTSAAWKAEHREATPATACVATKLNARPFRPAANAFAQPADPSQPAEQRLVENETLPNPDAAPMQSSPPSASTDEELPAPPPDQGEGIIAEDWQSA